MQIVNLNVGAFDAHKMGSFPVIGDAKRSLLALHERLADVGFAPINSYAHEIAAAQEETRKVREHDLQDFPDERMSQAQVIDVLNKRITAQDALVLGSGGVVEGIHKAWDPSNGAEIHFEYANSCMGHEIPAGLGYRLAQQNSDGEVYVLIGDGTYLMQPTELVTAVQEHQKIIVIVIDNRGHQCIWPLQAAKGGGREFGTQLRERNPVSGRLDGPIVDIDIAANAASMGAAAWSTETIEEFAAALEEAQAVTGPAVIVANVEQFRYLSGNGAFWDVGVPLTSQREVTRAGVAKHLVGRERQRYFGATVAPSER